MGKNITRRDLLKAAGIVSTGALVKPASFMLAHVISGIVDKAYGNTTTGPGTPRNLILFQLLSAPPRWYWDPLSPYDDVSTMISNPNLGTKFVLDTVSNTYKSIKYETFSFNGINLPWLWHSQVPTASGGSRPMTDLLEYILCVQGVNVVNPAHTGAQDLQFRPSGISNTITSLTGDVSQRPIPFIGMNTSPNPYNSKLQKSGVNGLSMAGNWLENLLTPLMVGAPSFTSQLNTLDSALSQVFSNIENAMTSKHMDFGISASANRNALLAIKKDFGNLSTEFQTRRDKYRSLLQIACAPIPTSNPISIFEGVNDYPVMSEGVDLRAGLNYWTGTQMVYGMAEQFALIEYSLSKELTTSIACGLNPLINCNNDEHDVSFITSVLVNNLWNRGFAACLLELITELIAIDVWKDTVFSISAEFGRMPKNFGMGSDHAPEASSYTFLSGCLKGYEFVGNTKRSSGISSYPGTWGYTASNDVYGFLGLGHIAATTASLLNVASPVTSSPSLVKLENGLFTSKLGKTRII